MADGRTLEQRLDEIEARTAIAGLIHEYARLVRRDEGERVHTLFTQDGTFEVRIGHPNRPDFVQRNFFASPAEIEEHMLPNKGKPHPVPQMHNLVIEVDGDTATANCIQDGQIYGTAHWVYGEYHDSFRRVDGRWHFSSRIYTIYSGAVQG